MTRRGVPFGSPLALPHAEAAPSAGLSRSIVGTSAIGSSYKTSNTRAFKAITLAEAGFVANIALAAKGNGSSVGGIGVALYADNGGAPGDLIAAGASDPYGAAAYNLGVYIKTTAHFIARPLGVYVPAGDYWIAGMATYQAGATQWAYEPTGGSDYVYTFTTTQSWWPDGSLQSPVATAHDYSLYAEIIR